MLKKDLQTQDYEFTLEFSERYPEVTCLHSEVYRWTPSVAKSYRKDLDALLDRHKLLFVYVEPDNKKLKKMLSIFCFEKVAERNGLEIYRRDNNGFCKERY